MHAHFSIRGHTRLVTILLSAFPGIALAQQLSAPSPPTGNSVNFDVGTLAGVLGVVLTIVFFVIGYRQTIGARKERVVGVDRDILETLLRRFTLETDFVMTAEETERFISGKAIENRVKRMDALSIDELWVILYSRVVSTDYVSAKQRKPLLEKINKCFEQKQDDNQTLIPSPIDELKKATDKGKFAILGFISALMSGLSMWLVARIIIDAGVLSDVSSLAKTLPLIFGGIFITATALVIFYGLKEKETSTKETDFAYSRPRPQEFERGIIQRLRAIGVDMDMRQGAVDLILAIKNRRVAVDLKYYVPTLRLAKSMLKRMGERLKQFECEKGYFVVASPIPNQIRELNSEKVKFLDVDEFFNILTEPESITRIAD